MATCSWPLGNQQTLEFNIYPQNKNWKEVAGLYIFAFKDKGGLWCPLYIGQTENFADRLPSHECWARACQLGATHIHTRTVLKQADRTILEKALIVQLQPPMNVQERLIDR